MTVTVKRQLLGKEDLLLGTGTVEQQRRLDSAATTTISRISASDIPSGDSNVGDEIGALKAGQASLTTALANTQAATGAEVFIVSTAAQIPSTPGENDIILPLADITSGEVTYNKGVLYKWIITSNVGAWTAQNASKPINLAPEIVDTANLAAGAVTTAKIENANVTAAKIADGAIGTSKLAADAVDGTKIADDAITKDQLADDAVEAAAIKDGAVGTSALANDAVTADKLADDSVTKDQLADAAVEAAAIKDGAVTADKLANDSVTKDQLADDAVEAAAIKDGAVGTSALADDAVTADKLSNYSVDDINIKINSKLHKISGVAIEVYNLPERADRVINFFQNEYYRVTNNANKATGNATYAVNDVIKYTPSLAITARLNQTFSAFEKMPFTLTSAGKYIILDNQNVSLGKIVGQDNLKGRVIDDSNNIRVTDTYFGSGAGSGVASMVATPASNVYNFLCIDPESGKICYYAHSAYTKSSTADGAGGATRTFPNSAPQEVVRIDKWYQRASSAPSKPAEQTPASGSFFVHGSTYSVTGWTVDTPPAGSNTLYSVLAIMTYDKIFFSEVVTEPAGQDDIIHIDKLYRRASSKPEKPADLTGTYNSDSIAAADNWYRHKPATPANQTIWSTLAVITAHSIKFSPVIEEVADPHGTDPVLIFRKTSGSLSNDSANPENIDTGYNIDQFRWIEFVRYSSGAIGGNNTELSTTKHRVKNANNTYNRRFTCNDSQTVMTVVTGLNSDGTAITTTFRAMGIYMLHFINNSSFYEIVDSNGADTPFEIYGYY